jgi:hypothetical protein
MVFHCVTINSGLGEAPVTGQLLIISNSYLQRRWEFLKGFCFWTGDRQIATMVFRSPTLSIGALSYHLSLDTGRACDPLLNKRVQSASESTGCMALDLTNNALKIFKNEIVPV